MSAKSLAKNPALQQLFEEMHSSEAYVGIFPETFCLINLMLTLPFVTAIVEGSVSQMKNIKQGSEIHCQTAFGTTNIRLLLLKHL